MLQVIDDGDSFFPPSAIYEWIADRLLDCPSPLSDSNDQIAIKLSLWHLIPSHPISTDAIVHLDAETVFESQHHRA